MGKKSQEKMTETNENERIETAKQNLTLKEKLKAKMAFGLIEKIQNKIEDVSYETQWKMIKQLEKVYVHTGKVPTEKMIQDRQEAIKHFKDKEFLCKFPECEEKAQQNGYCINHGG